jgi:type I restriction enzyme S subunit
MQQLFTQALRFKDDHGNDFPDWEEKGLGNSIDLLSGFPFASEDILDGQATNDRERILLMRGVNITEGSIRHSEDQDRYYCGDVAKLQKYKLEVGDMVIGMDGSKVGKNSALVGESEKGALLVQRVARIRALAGTSLPFIYQHVNSFLFHRYVDQVKTSSGIPHISAKQIREFTIGFPCLAEQTKIANFLTALDRKIESVAQQITHTQTFKKGLLQQMFV